MKCPKCNEENFTEATRCEGCGYKLTIEPALSSRGTLPSSTGSVQLVEKRQTVLDTLIDSAKTAYDSGDMALWELKEPKSEAANQDGSSALASAHGYAADFPKLTEYEENVFKRFWKRHTPGCHFNGIQLEGDKQLPVVAAGYRMVKKGVLTHWRSCQWGLSDLGEQMAEERQRPNVKAHRSAPAQPRQETHAVKCPKCQNENADCNDHCWKCGFDFDREPARGAGADSSGALG